MPWVLPTPDIPVCTDPHDVWYRYLDLYGMERVIPVTHEIALAAYDLPGEFHRDPADRILVATAVVHDLTLMTADDRILAYPYLLSSDARA